MSRSHEPTVHGPEPITLAGRVGARYWVHRPTEFTGIAAVDVALSSFPLAIFTPQRREPRNIPVVIGLQGLATPFQWNASIIPTLLDMGIACALIDVPLAGERGPARVGAGDMVAQFACLRENGVELTSDILMMCFEAVAGDLPFVASILDSHGIGDGRLALFGVGFGCLMSALAFARGGLGNRLLGVIGHADLPALGRTFVSSLPLTDRVLATVGRTGSPSTYLAGWAASLFAHDEDFGRINPSVYAGSVSSERRARFLVGEADPLVSIADSRASAASFANGHCYAVPGMAHGESRHGPSFEEHVRYFLQSQLGDWCDSYYSNQQ